MKTKFLFVGLLLGAAVLTSCKKDYTCECSVDFLGETITTSTTINATKKDAKEACEAGSVASGIVCVIK